MKLIAHRGLWLEKDSSNSKKSLIDALNMGFSIETDIRDFNREIVVSHDPTNHSTEYPSIIFLSELAAGFPKLDLFLNVKSDGLLSLGLAELFENFSNVFFFDMSNPELVKYKHAGLNCLDRISNYEPGLQIPTQGIWFDNWIDLAPDIPLLNKYESENQVVAITSPELHGREHRAYWRNLKNGLISEKNYLCTDFPIIAEEFFND